VLGLKGGYRNRVARLLKPRPREGGQTVSENDKITGFRHFAIAVGEAILSTDAAKRELLAQTVEDWIRVFPDDYNWATGLQAPALLFCLMVEIELAVSDNRKKSDFDLASEPAQGSA
jgi:hypothetical protein